MLRSASARSACSFSRRASSTRGRYWSGRRLLGPFMTRLARRWRDDASAAPQGSRGPRDPCGPSGPPEWFDSPTGVPPLRREPCARPRTSASKASAVALSSSFGTSERAKIQNLGMLRKEAERLPLGQISQHQVQVLAPNPLGVESRRRALREADPYRLCRRKSGLCFGNRRVRRPEQLDTQHERALIRSAGPSASCWLS